MLEFIKKTDLLPVGRERSTIPAVAIGPSGTLRLSAGITKHLNGNKLVAHSFNPETKKITLGIFAKPHAKDWKESDYLQIRQEGKGKQNAVVPFTAALQTIAKNGHMYDYKASGNQVLPAELAKTKEGAVLVTFELPAGARTPKPFTPRKRKAKDAPAVAEGQAAVAA